MRHIVRRGFHFTASLPRLVHAALVALLALAALAAPLTLAEPVVAQRHGTQVQSS